VHVLLVTTDRGPESVLPALCLLPHHISVAAPAIATMFDTVSDTRSDTAPHDAVLVDARTQLAAARRLCRILATAGVQTPVIAVLTEGGLSVVSSQWALHDILLTSAGPAEIDARLRLLPTSAAHNQRPGADALVLGELVIDKPHYTAWLRGRDLRLTYTEFELLSHLAHHSGRVCTRAQLLTQVWGHDFFGGIRTVDVHVRRLRAKLGRDQLIATVRNVGYMLIRPGPRSPDTDHRTPPRPS
jgi:DNA-binding response OmpR family regulator